MASARAIEAVCDTIVGVLRDSLPSEPATPPLQFSVLSTGELDGDTPAAGVTLLLHRVHVDGTERAPRGRDLADGRRQVPQLPVQLHLLLTMWASQASLQHYLAGWTMRTMADNPLLPAGLLNRRYEPESTVFRSDESVEVSPATMANDELVQLWEVLGGVPYHLSLPYLARGVRIESTRATADGAPVFERRRDHRLLEVGP